MDASPADGGGEGQGTDDGRTSVPKCSQVAQHRPFFAGSGTNRGRFDSIIFMQCSALAGQLCCCIQSCHVKCQPSFFFMQASQQASSYQQSAPEQGNKCIHIGVPYIYMYVHTYTHTFVHILRGKNRQ